MSASDLFPNSPPPLPSPCIGVCQMDANRQFCKGCLRTIPEIRAWATADEATKQAILQELKQRRKILLQQQIDEHGNNKDLSPALQKQFRRLSANRPRRRSQPNNFRRQPSNQEGS